MRDYICIQIYVRSYVCSEVSKAIRANVFKNCPRVDLRREGMEEGSWDCCFVHSLALSEMHGGGPGVSGIHNDAQRLCTHIQGDQAACPKPTVYIDLKVAF